MTILELAERDYRYGTGILRLRITTVDRTREVQLDGEPWVPVRGMRLRRDGTEMAPVRLLVRAARLCGLPRG
jgi:hypothetical protein